MSRRESRSARKKRITRNRIIAADAVLLIIAIVVCVVLTRRTTASNDWIYKRNYNENTRETQSYVLSEDTDAPNVWTASHIYCSVGDTLEPDDYLDYVYAYDEYDTNPDISVDYGLVDTSTAGTYSVGFTVTDASGNKKYASTDVVVCDDTPAVLAGFQYNEEDLYARAEAILDSIITDDMTDLQKIFAVFYYVRNMTYIGNRTTMEYKEEAYYLLSTGSDNCYGNVSLSKILLEMLGYQSFMVEGYEMGESYIGVHYWNMVSIDGGKTWYYYDPATWAWENQEIPLCMITTEQLLAVSEARGNTHNFDSTLYPPTGDPLWTEETAASLGISLTG